MGKRISGIRVDGAAVQRCRLVPLSLLFKDRAEIVQGLGVTWLKLDGAVEDRFRLLGVTALETEDTVIVVRVGFTGIERYRFAIRLD